MMKVLILFSFLLSLFFNQSHAVCQTNTSKEVDLRNEFGPIRDQDSVGWCYAFVTADILGHYLVKQGELKGDNTERSMMVSPIGVATWYNKTFYNYQKHYDKIASYSSEEISSHFKDTRVVLEGGFVDRAMRATLAKGYCLETDAPSESFSLVLEKNCSEKNLCASDLLELLNLIYDYSELKPIKNQETLCLIKDVVQAAYPSLLAEEIEGILKHSTRKTIFTDLVSSTCKRKVKVSPPKMLSFEGNSESIFKKIDLALERGKPVAIGYTSEFLTSDSNQKGDYPHESLLVGKKVDPISCKTQYILRNSWGPQCGIYEQTNDKYWDCLKNVKEKQSSQIEILKRKIDDLDKITAEDKKDQVVFEKMNLEFEIEKNMNLLSSREKYCSSNYPAIPRNSRVHCDSKTGYLFVDKDALKENLLDITYIQ